MTKLSHSPIMDVRFGAAGREKSFVVPGRFAEKVRSRPEFEVEVVSPLPSALLVLENIFCRWMLTDHSHDKTLALTDYGRSA
jgi:hypothetical protein